MIKLFKSQKSQFFQQNWEKHHLPKKKTQQVFYYFSSLVKIPVKRQGAVASRS